MPAAPVVSIVIPVWNRSDTLGRAIASVLAQTNPDFEVVVLDNGSDEPAAVAEVVAAANDERVRLVRSEVNLGPSGGRNLGVEHSRGRFVGFLDSDDEFEPEWVERMTAPFADPGCQLVTCGYQRYGDEGASGAPVLPRALGPAFHGLVARVDGPPAFLVPRSVFDRVAGYDERLWFGENTELGLRLAETVPDGRGVAAVLRPLVRWYDDGRPRDYSRARVDAAELMLVDHADALRRDPEMRRNHLAIAGVGAAKLGEYRRARRHLGVLLRTGPGPKALGRYALAWIPPLARRVWGAP